MRALLLLVVLSAWSARAEETLKWKAPTPDEITYFEIAQLMIVVDVAQTYLILNNLHDDPVHHITGARELNPILGPQPSTAKLLTYAGAGMIGSAVVWYLLPPDVRWLVPTLVIAGETPAVVGNFMVLF